MKYRPEIDGLRAVAVLPVILFHAGFSLFSGGFVGVDVFFVISGYLITSIILGELAQGRFSLAYFWERRIRRILPALFVVMAACVPIAWMYFLPADFKNFSKSLIAVSTYTSNILFWRESGYFDASAELKPLLHTWSLAVEEQYYLLFPLFMMLCWRFGRKRIALIMAIVLALSLLVAHVGVVLEPSAAFYLLPTRGWELMVGAMAAFYLFEKKEVTPHQSLSLLGLLMVLAAVFIYDQKTPFPGMYALLPTLGVALIILFAGKGTFVYWLLSRKSMVGVGLLSYSAYLWHQPLFAFTRYLTAHPATWVMLTLSAVSIGLAYLSWRFVETPFRQKGRLSRKTVLIFALACSLAFIAIGTVGTLANGFKSRLPTNIEWQSLGEKVNTIGDVCKPVVHADGFISSCFFGDTTAEKTVALYGDSHALSLTSALDEKLKAEKLRGLRINVRSCEIIPRIRTNQKMRDKNLTRCLPNFERAMTFLKENADIVIVAGRWTMRSFPVEGVETLYFDNGEGGVEQDLGTGRVYLALGADGIFSTDAEPKAYAFQQLLAALDGLNMPVALVYPIPEAGWNVAKKNFLHFKQQNKVLDNLSTSHTLFTKRNQFVNTLFDSYSFNNPQVVRIKPEVLFCSTQVDGRCMVQHQGKALYYDDDHLSEYGASFIVNKIFEELPK